MNTMISDFGADFLPRRKTLHSAGYDMMMPYDLQMEPDKWYDIDTGIHLEHGDIKESQFLMLMPRSGLGFKNKLKLANTVGIIDADYRQSIKARISVEEPLTLNRGDSFMQAIVLEYGLIANEVPPTEVRKGGFGSTGA